MKHSRGRIKPIYLWLILHNSLYRRSTYVLLFLLRIILLFYIICLTQDIIWPRIIQNHNKYRVKTMQLKFYYYTHLKYFLTIQMRFLNFIKTKMRGSKSPKEHFLELQGLFEPQHQLTCFGFTRKVVFCGGTKFKRTFFGLTWKYVFCGGKQLEFDGRQFSSGQTQRRPTIRTLQVADCKRSPAGNV
jgi:hypothetical protein